MRIISLLPAATEWVSISGMADQLVGRSHECDYPAEAVAGVPVVTHADASVQGRSTSIDAAVRERVQQGLSLFGVDLERLRELEPDLILTQDQCEVCAVSLPQLEEALAESGARAQVLSLQPMTLREVLAEGLRVGRALGRVETVMAWMGDAEARLHRLREHLGLRKRADPATFPTVACVEWMEPLMTAGHWMPDVCEMAGGRAVLADGGEPSRYVTWDELCAADPDVLAVMPCGFSLGQTQRDLSVLTERPSWHDLRAVQQGRVVLFDGNAYFNRPGPRIYRAIELLATAIHPTRLTHEAVDVEPWELRLLEPIAEADNS